MNLFKTKERTKVQRMTDEEKQGILRNLSLSIEKMEEYINNITSNSVQKQIGFMYSEKIMDIYEQDVNDARCDLEWVEEYIIGVGEKHKQVYVDALERVDKLLEKIEKAMDALGN